MTSTVKANVDADITLNRRVQHRARLSDATAMPRSADNGVASAGPRPGPGPGRTVR